MLVLNLFWYGNLRVEISQEKFLTYFWWCWDRLQVTCIVFCGWCI